MYKTVEELMNHIADKCRERGLLTITGLRTFDHQFCASLPKTVYIADYNTDEFLCYEEDRRDEEGLVKVLGWVTGKQMLINVVHRHNGTDENKSIDFSFVEWRHSSGRGDKDRFPRQRIRMNQTDKTIDKKIDKAIDTYFEFIKG